MEDFQKYTANYKFSIREAIKQMDIGGAGFVIVIDDKKNVVGVISDGDFRRAVLNGIELFENVVKITNKNFKYLNKRCSKDEGLKYLNQFNVEFLPVIENNKLIDVFANYLYISDSDPVSPSHQIDLPVVIMAGGRGTRMAPVTKVLPKPLIPIGEKTIIEIIMDNYVKYGMKDFFISVNYKAKLFKAYFEETKSVYNINYIDETKELGTAGALYFLKGKMKTDFFVSKWDIIIKDDYSDIYKFHKDGDFTLTIITSLQHLKIPYGVCKIGKGGVLKEIQEKPEYDLFINTGMYVLSPEVLNYIPQNEYYHITHLLKLQPE